ncbi:DUF1328 domain-containing protein [Pseudooceanicola sp. CBS1P-1]|uniref:UPF0391 membrane protein GR170_05005 n=1 Tax=Pseudooceanicola albus TaxID=2692189 RepID=A0A6L7G3I8_9RHOB|nr:MULTISPECIES: DUF1328 family protein [Pseudooceanicola]MBT9382644.1 DUF1328 domain-containing protein [Pseudooceanicola endophyticus]MXN17183.1 DUF1328 domain-containing protein [Pseudooceanicola albus]
MPLIWPIVFFSVALVTAAFAFGGIAAVSAGIAQFLFVLFAALGVATLAMHVFEGQQENIHGPRPQHSRE